MSPQLPFTDVPDAIEEIRAGRMIVVVDDEDRENEGDLTLAAEKVTPEAINFMAKHGRGLVCLAMTEERLEHLNIGPMTAENTSQYGTAFCEAIDARQGVTTGISAYDRARTIQVAIDPATKPSDLARPGHVFPLRARKGGVLVRAGQTEASVDLARLAGMVPAGIICEIMKDDGSMARVPDLTEFCRQHNMKMLTVAELIRYRMAHERYVNRVGEALIDTRFGEFRLIAYSSEVDGGESHTEGKARAGMGVDVADFENSGTPGVAITNFDNEMIGLYRLSGKSFEDIAPQSGVGIASRNSLGFGCAFLDVNLDGWLDFAVANGHIDETVRNIRGNVGYAQPPQLFLSKGKGNFHDVASEAGGSFDQPKVGRGLAYGDFDRDGDLDLLITTNNGPAYLYRNDQLAAHHSIRFQLVGTKSNRDAIGATVQISSGGLQQSRTVKGGSSYLSQSELPVTFGLEKRDQVERVVIYWPSGRTEEFKNLSAGRTYDCTEGKGIVPRQGY